MFSCVPAACTLVPASNLRVCIGSSVNGNGHHSRGPLMLACCLERLMKTLDSMSSKDGQSSKHYLFVYHRLFKKLSDIWQGTGALVCDSFHLHSGWEPSTALTEVSALALRQLGFASKLPTVYVHDNPQRDDGYCLNQLSLSPRTPFFLTESSFGKPRGWMVKDKLVGERTLYLIFLAQGPTYAQYDSRCHISPKSYNFCPSSHHPHLYLTPSMYVSQALTLETLLSSVPKFNNNKNLILLLTST